MCRSRHWLFTYFCLHSPWLIPQLSISFCIDLIIPPNPKSSSYMQFANLSNVFSLLSSIVMLNFFSTFCRDFCFVALVSNDSFSVLFHTQVRSGIINIHIIPVYAKLRYWFMGNTKQLSLVYPHIKNRCTWKQQYIHYTHRTDVREHNNIFTIHTPYRCTWKQQYIHYTHCTTIFSLYTPYRCTWKQQYIHYTPDRCTWKQ